MLLSIVLPFVLFSGAIFGEPQNGSSIQIGSVIRVGEAWFSPAGTFAFGFSSGGGAAKFNVAIWYNVSPSILVWSAVSSDRASQLQVSKNAILELQADKLVVKDGNTVMWQTCGDTKSTCASVRNAKLLNNGNFVLAGFNDSAAWTSFSTPTDTLLPGQELVGVSQVLVSGRYKLRLKIDRALLESIDFKPPSDKSSRNYWALKAKSSKSGAAAPGYPKLNFSSEGMFSFMSDSESEGATLYAMDVGSNMVMLRRLKLEVSGNLIMYSFTNGSWVISWQAVLNECEIYATCGPFGLCNFRPIRNCSCPPGFHHVDKSDDASGCDYNVPIIGCGTPTKFVEIVRAHYEFGDEPISTDPISLEDCKSQCLSDCQCVGLEYVMNGSAICYRKAGKLYNGRQTIGGEAHAIVFLKIAAADTSRLPSVPDFFETNVSATNPDTVVKKVVQESYFAKQGHVIVLVVVLVAACTILAMSLFVLYLVRYRDSKRMKQGFLIEGAPEVFTYKELQSATENFSESLGSGAFGSVYKGALPDKRIIAVKVLNGVIVEKQFTAEVSTMGKIHHVNLVRMLGYCAEDEHRLLVLEYMPNGSLEKLLFKDESQEKSSSISGMHDRFFYDWSTRFSIALGVARGITYLHEECHECILHCDIKPHNILLDDSFSPKVSDFGLAKLVSKERALSVTTVRGTRGYIAPEWWRNCQITPKADVYSYGMLLMEIISGRNKFMLTASLTEIADEGIWNFPAWAYQKLKDSNIGSIADPRMARENIDWKQLERTMKVAFWCIQLEVSARPSMSKVVQMLEDTVEVPQPPLPKMLDDSSVVLDNPVPSAHEDQNSLSSVGLNGR